MLTSFNGQTITYDEIGNPLQYRDGMSFTWAKGRQLQGITKDGLNASYTYDENGLRISKMVNGVTTKIHRANGQMLGLNVSDGKDMTFVLDGNGNVYGVHYDHYSSNQTKSETYYFAYNAQGDVIGIYDFGGRLIATYDYDEWGNCTVNVLAEDGNSHAVDSPDHIAQVNPFRYRGYFYDAETGFYYLNSRYYDPGTGRFVNADAFTKAGQGVLSCNMFAYCVNNPIMYFDTNGYFVFGIGFTFQGGAITGGVFSALIVMDTSGNVGVLIVPGMAVCTPQASASVSVLISWCDTIYDMEGLSYSIGGSADLGLSVGADILMIGNDICGFMVNMGGGVAFPFDAHFATTIGELLSDMPEVIQPSSSSKPSSPVAQNLPSKQPEKPKSTIYDPNSKPSVSGLVYIPTISDIIYHC